MKKILSIVLSVLMLINALGITTLAGTYSQDGNTYTSNDPSDLPVPDGDKVWEGPTHQSTCDKEAHTHSNSCYELTCGGLSLTHWFHRDSCYDKTKLVCTKEEHQHSSLTCPTVYTWTATQKSEVQWREWWPVYWGYDTGSAVTDMSAVSAVTAGGVNVKFTNTGVSAQTAFNDNTADSGDTLRGVAITVKEGYYVTAYRFVCGNHTECYTTGYDEREYIPNADGSYTSSFVFYPSTSVYDHWNAGDITTNPSSRYYMPWDKPTGSNIYYTFDNGSNLNYPFYILFEVQQDTTSYDLTYDWGSLSLTAEVPEGVRSMARNASHTVSAPSASALTEALELGYAFAGWKVVGSGYDANAMVQEGNTVTNYGSDITLVAQWTEKNTVIYSYTGTYIPEDAPALPAIVEYHAGDTVDVAEVPTLVGYKFVGWTTSDVTVTDVSFTMPNSPVHFTGEFVRDDTQTKTISYTVKYLFNNAERAEYPTKTETATVWVNDPDTLPWDASYILDLTSEGWTLAGTKPATVPALVANGAEIVLYYVGEADISLDKSVAYADGSAITGEVKVGDTLIYKIRVTNNGTADATGVQIDDAFNCAGSIEFSPIAGITYSTTTNTEGVDLYTFVIDSIPAGQYVDITYTYTVVEEDAGRDLNNFAYYYNSTDGSQAGDTETVPVTPQYTLTVEHYLDGTFVDSKTASYTFNEGTAWSIVISDAVDSTVTTWDPFRLVKPYGIVGPNGVMYAFDDPATTDALSGTLTSDVTVKLYYSTDEKGGGSDGEEPDGIPDKYQVKTVYVSEVGGTITGITSEYSTIYRTDAFVDGDWAEHGYAKVVGSCVQTSAGYEFKHWDVDRAGSTTLHLDYDEDLTDENIVYEDAHGGDVYTFTARFNTKKLEIKKNVSESNANVGDVLHYEIHVHNMGTVDLTNVKIEDVLGYADGTAFDGEIAFAGMDGVTYQDGTFTIASLAAGQYVNIIYTYTVREADEGKTLTNTAVAEYGGDDEPEAETTTDIDTRERYTVIYTDGVDDAEVFGDQMTSGLLEGDDTPEFVGTPERDGYKFNGWSPAVSEKVTGDATYVALWLAINTVEYRYDGNVPDGAPDAPDAKEYTEGDTVNVEPAVNAPEGYTFSGWTTTDVKVDGGEFEMPANKVVFIGTFTKDDTQTKELSYTVEYYFNGVKNDNYTTVVKDSVWVNDPDTLPWDASLVITVPGWEFDHSDPAAIPADVADKATIKLYYVGTIVDLGLTKDVVDSSGAAITSPVLVGDVLTYTITITNNGNVAASDVVITDTINGSGTIDFTNTANVTYADGKFTVAELGIGETVTITYTYTVVAADGGKTLKNVAVTENNGDPIEDEVEVIVESQYTLIVEYYFDGVLDDTRTETKKMNDGDTWTVTPEASIVKDGVTYVFDDPATTDVLSGVAADVTVKLYYAADENGGGQGGEEPDNIPDKYQKKVIFKVVNGTWSDDTTDDIVVYVTLLDDAGEWDENGSAVVDTIVPTGMKANEGFKNGEWDEVFPVTVTGTDDVTYTHTFQRSTTPIIPGDVVNYIVEHYKANADGTYPTDPTDREIKGGKIGDTVTAVPKTYEGYTLNLLAEGTVESGTLVKILNMGDIVVLKLYYDVDENGGGEGGEDPDNIPDKYQIKVTFQVVNGAWNDGSRADKIVYVTLRDVHGNISPNGIGLLTKDQIPEAGKKPNTGYFEGDWHVTPTTYHPIEKETTFVYEYEFINPINPTLGKVTVVKVDADDMTKTLSGVVFRLYRGTISLGTYVGKYTTDEDGMFNIIQSAGTYYLVEERAHEGYTISVEPIRVTILPGMGGMLTITNKKTEVPDVFTGDHYAYIIGRDDGLVHPEASITRAEVATIFFRMLSDSVRNANLTTENEYLDVKEGDWYNTAVSTLTAMGVLNGYNGMFRPDDFITRAEFAAIAARFDANADTTNAAFNDIYGHWGQKEISQAANNGWVLGYEDGTFKPDQLITRAEAMTLVNRVLQRIPESTADLIDGMIEWPDNMDTDAWYYLAVQEATNSHDYIRKENGFESWIALLPTRDWTVYEK